MLIIVSRTQPAQVTYLKSAFKKESIYVILDRRFGERRQLVGADRGLDVVRIRESASPSGSRADSVWRSSRGERQGSTPAFVLDTACLCAYSPFCLLHKPSGSPGGAMPLNRIPPVGAHTAAQGPAHLGVLILLLIVLELAPILFPH